MPQLRRAVVPMLTVGAFAVPSAAYGAAPSPAQDPAAKSRSQVSGGAPGTERAVPRIAARVLRPGSRGADVRRLQQLLNAVGIDDAVTASYRYATSRAVQRFQLAAGLQASGVAGPATIGALRAAARGPRSVEASGGLGFGRQAGSVSRLGARMPLAVGMSGRDVRQLQDFLRRAGVRNAPLPSGEYGPRTAAAVRRYERRYDRPVDGSVDAGDIYKLFTIVGEDARPGDAGDPSEGLPAPPLAPGDRARVTADGRAIAPEGAPEAVQKIIAAGNRIATKPYKWGGGHGRWEDTGYDCSGTVSYALRGAHLLKSPLASYDYFDWEQAGKGRWVTIYTNSGHMFMVVAGLRFDTSGRGAGGSRWQEVMRSTSGYRVRHPAGL